MVLAPFVNYNMDAIFPFCAEAAQSKLSVSDLKSFKSGTMQINGLWIDDKPQNF
jgi:hypothetical protein